MRHPSALLLALTCLLALLPACEAQEREPAEADTAEAMPMDDAMPMDGAMGAEQTPPSMPQLMEMHEAMMADAEMYPRVMPMMMAEPDLRQAMAEAMGGGVDAEQIRARMDQMTPAERRQLMERVHAQMGERMAAFSDERQALAAQMMAMHQAMLNDETMHGMMMNHPEIGPMLERMGDADPMGHSDMMHDDGVHDDADSHSDGGMMD